MIPKNTVIMIPNQNFWKLVGNFKEMKPKITSAGLIYKKNRRVVFEDVRKKAEIFIRGEAILKN